MMSSPNAMDISPEEVTISKNVTLKKNKGKPPGPSWKLDTNVQNQVLRYESKLKKPVKRINNLKKKAEEPTIRELMNMFSDRFDSIEEKIDNQAEKVNSIEEKIMSMDKSVKTNNDKIEKVENEVKNTNDKI